MSPTSMPSHAPETPMLIAWTALTLALLGLPLGCSSGDAAADLADPLDACALLTSADVTEVLDIEDPEVSAMKRGDDTAWLSGCNYHGEANGNLRSAGLMVSPHGVAAGPQKAFAAEQTSLVETLGDDAALEPVARLGDRAGWQDFDTGIGQLIIFDGPYRLTVTANAAEGVDQRSTAEQLAERVLARLPAR
mgnify:CR=1 FL=1